MNYAWANPSTGIREQASTKEEARLLAWEALQKLETGAPEHVAVFEQEPAGSASPSAWDLTNSEPWADGYAWTDLNTGQRNSTDTIEIAVCDIQTNWPAHVPFDSVTIYRQRRAFWVNFDDPKPEPPAPIVIPPDTPSSLLQSVMEGSCADLGRAQLLAMLWIAESLQKAVVTPPQAGAREQWRFWDALKAWWRNLWEVPTVPLAFKLTARICAMCNTLLEDPDGTICPKCARAILEANTLSGGTPINKEEKVESPQEAEEKRARAVRNRAIDPAKPHVYSFTPGVWNTGLCLICGKIEAHAIHGYTGD
jgi:hypothetical protein